MDGAASHRAWNQKFNLNFPLLADSGGAMTRRWDVLGGSDPRRVTFVLDGAGRIAAVFDPVKVDGHTEQVLEALGRVGG